MSTQEFHDHLDRCAQCANHPMNLCSIGYGFLHGASTKPTEGDRLAQLEAENAKYLLGIVSLKDKLAAAERATVAAHQQAVTLRTRIERLAAQWGDDGAHGSELLAALEVGPPGADAPLEELANRLQKIRVNNDVSFAEAIAIAGGVETALRMLAEASAPLPDTLAEQIAKIPRWDAAICGVWPLKFGKYVNLADVLRVIGAPLPTPAPDSDTKK